MVFKLEVSLNCSLGHTFTWNISIWAQIQVKWWELMSWRVFSSVSLINQKLRKGEIGPYNDIV